MPRRRLYPTNAALAREAFGYAYNRKRAVVRRGGRPTLEFDILMQADHLQWWCEVHGVDPDEMREGEDQWRRWARSYFRVKAAKKRAKHAHKMRCLRLKWRLEAQQAAGLDSVDVHRLRQQYERSRPRDALGRYLPKHQGGM
jgi:hypothetical protein